MYNNRILSQQVLFLPFVLYGEHTYISNTEYYAIGYNLTADKTYCNITLSYSHDECTYCIHYT